MSVWYLAVSGLLNLINVLPNVSDVQYMLITWSNCWHNTACHFCTFVSDIWNKFLEFEANVGDLTSIVKVEKRRTQALGSVSIPTTSVCNLWGKIFFDISAYKCTDGIWLCARSRTHHCPSSLCAGLQSADHGKRLCHVHVLCITDCTLSVCRHHLFGTAFHVNWKIRTSLDCSSSPTLWHGFLYILLLAGASEKSLEEVMCKLTFLFDSLAHGFADFTRIVNTFAF